MKRIFIAVTALVILLVGWVVFGNPRAWFFQPRTAHEPIATTTADMTGILTASSTETTQVVADNLSVPWGLAFLPSGNLLVTERTGQLIELSPDGSQTAASTIASVTPRGEGGLLGIALHPNFADNRWIYLYETTKTRDRTRNRVVRYQYHNSEISDQTVIIDGIPGAAYHDGGRIDFGPENTYLFVTTGDAGSSRQAQSTSTRNGKILRVHPDGSIPETNPFSNAIYSYGHRNPQGLAWDKLGRLWSTEHGRSGVRSGLDEINLIKRGANYGWPYLEGDETCQNDRMYSPAVPDKTQSNCSMLPPVIHSGPDITWAPASAAIYDKTLYFGGLRGQTIYTVPIKKSGVEIGLGEVKAHYKKRFGRIRTVQVGSNRQYLYVTTSNTDDRGNPRDSDDRLIKINLRQFK